MSFVYGLASVFVVTFTMSGSTSDTVLGDMEVTATTTATYEIAECEDEKAVDPVRKLLLRKTIEREIILEDDPDEDGTSGLCDTISGPHGGQAVCRVPLLA